MSTQLQPQPSPATADWLRRVIGADVTALTPLTGGIAQSVTAVTAGDREYVLRLWSRPGWRDTDPDHSPENEIAALTALSSSNLPVPLLVAADPAGEHCEYPALLMTRLPGTILSSATHREPAAEPLTDDMLRQLVEAAETLHGLAVPDVGAYQSYNDLSDPRPPAGSPRPQLWERAYEIAAGGSPPAPAVFIHRDYHPGNTLWESGRLTGIIDWTTASRGPAGVDLGHLRWNLVMAYSQEHADTVLQFTDEHDPYHDPYWDLRTLLDTLPDDDLSPARLARLEHYLETLLG